MAQHKVAYIAKVEPDTTLVEEQLEGLDYEMSVHVCSSQGEAIEAIKGADVIINNSVRLPREVIEEIDTAKAIVSMGHGFDGIDHNAATEHGVMVVNTAGFVTNQVADHTIMMVLACAKKLTVLHDIVRSGRWTAQAKLGLSDIPHVDGAVLGIVGLGNIGRATARRAAVFGMEVIAHDRYVPSWTAHDYGVELVDSLEELASRSDFVSILVPLNDETRKLIGASFFAAMKPTAYFINTCRGSTVDEAALIKALRDGRIAGAGLDVFEKEPTSPDNPLLKMDNVIVTPHSAGDDTQLMADGLSRLGEEAARILRGTWPMALANPEVRERVPSRPPAQNV